MSAPGENLKINGDRLWDSLMKMAQIGPGIAGGNNRQTLTDEDSERRYLFKRRFDDARLFTDVDTIGNMVARHEGMGADARLTGGKYDDVRCGLEIAPTEFL